MTWITVDQCNDFLTNTGRQEGWQDVGEKEQTAYVARASADLNAIPFADDIEPLFGQRFADGFYANSLGEAITDQPMPENLLAATAILAHYYYLNPRADLNLLDADIDNSLSPFIANLPAQTQQALWPYLLDEWKGRLFYREINRNKRRSAPQAAPVVG